MHNLRASEKHGQKKRHISMILNVVLPNKWEELIPQMAHIHLPCSIIVIWHSVLVTKSKLNCFISHRNCKLPLVACCWVFFQSVLFHYENFNKIIPDFIVINYIAINRLWKTDSIDFRYRFWKRTNSEVVLFLTSIHPSKLLWIDEIMRETNF